MYIPKRPRLPFSFPLSFLFLFPFLFPLPLSFSLSFLFSFPFSFPFHFMLLLQFPFPLPLHFMLLLLLLLPASAPAPASTPTLTLTPAIRCPRIPPLHLSVIWISVADSIKLLNLQHTSCSEYPVGIPPVADELQERVRNTNGTLRAGMMVQLKK